MFRGGITYGKYYYEKNVLFGPAVVSSYQLEKRANYSRILLDQSVEIPKDSSLLFFRDMDGWIVLNPFGMVLQSGCSYGGPQGVQYPENPTKQISESFEKNRKWVIDRIRQYKNTPIAEKYLWRIRPFNYTCRELIMCPDGELIYPKIGYAMNGILRRIISKAIISEQDYQ